MQNTISTPIAIATKPRLGFLGVGWIGRHRMEALLQEDLAQVGALCDFSAETLQQAKNLAPEAACYDNINDLLNEELDGIVIATPSALHAQQAIAALEKGLAVFCQKPLARTAAETIEIVQAAKAKDKLLGVDFSYRLTDGVQKVKEVIASGELGNIYAANLVFHNAYGPDKPWYFDAKLAGGGCVMDLGVHLIDLLFWLTGEKTVANVNSQLFSKGQLIKDPETQVEDYAAVQLTLDSGLTAQLACSWCLPAGYDAVIEATFYGTKGGITFKNVNGSFYDFTAERFWGTSRQVLSLPPDNWGGRAVAQWAKRLAAGQGFDPETEKYIEVAKTLDSIYRR